MEPISIPATAETARAFAMFITVVSSLLLEERPVFIPATPRRFGETYAPEGSQGSLR
jgi:hypothetical protein